MTLDDFAKLLEAFIKARPSMMPEQKRILIDFLAFVSETLPTAMFSKEHYDIIAKALRSSLITYKGNAEKQRAVLVAADSIGAALAKNDRAFNWDKFISVVKGGKS